MFYYYLQLDKLSWLWFLKSLELFLSAIHSWIYVKTLDHKGKYMLQPWVYVNT